MSEGSGDAKGLTAADALSYGLVSRVVPEGKVLEEAMQIAQRIAKRSRPIIMKAKKCANDAYEMGNRHIRRIPSRRRTFLRTVTSIGI